MPVSANRLNSIKMLVLFPLRILKMIELYLDTVDVTARMFAHPAVQPAVEQFTHDWQGAFGSKLHSKAERLNPANQRAGL